MDDWLRKDDPYRNMDRSDTEPDFLPDKKAEKEQERDAAAEDLKHNEDAAVDKGGDEDKSGLSGVREKEEFGGIVSNVTGKKSERDKKKGKGGIKGILKKKGPMGLIIGLILGGGALFGGAQMLMPFSLLAQFTETFNSMHTSANMRGDILFRTQMSGKKIRNPIKANLFGGETFRAPTEKQRARLAAQGIEYDNDYNGTGVRVLKFDDGSGEIKIVTADADTAAKIGNGATDFRTMYADNAAFFNGFNKGSMTWRGAISNWFGTMTVKFLRSNKITRNMFQDFQKKVQAANDGNVAYVAKQMMAAGAEDVNNGGMRVTDTKEEAGEDGSTKLVPETETAGADRAKRSTLVNNYDAAKSKIDKIGSTVQKGANVACTLMNVAGAVSLLVTANEAIQIINLVTGYFEAIDKVKAGNGEDSPINELSNALVEPIESGSVMAERTDVAIDNNDVAANYDGERIKTLTDETVLYKGTAMESSGIASLYGGGRVNPNDPSVASLNLSSSFKRIFGGIGVSMTAFSSCAVVKIMSNVTTAAVSFLDAVACVVGLFGAPFTFGGSTITCSFVVKDVLKSIAMSIAIGTAVAGLITIITPIAANMLTRDLISELGGQDLGNALTYGANMYLGNTHRANGGSLASIKKYKEFAIAQQSIIAENAKYERQTRSPFDPTSKYTFMGTLTTRMMGALSSSSIMNILKSSSSVISSSIIAMSPTATAYDISKDLYTDEEYAEICPYLASIGATGDAYCNPYAITDVETLNEDPVDIINRLQKGGNFLMKGGELDTVVVGKDESGADITNVVIDSNSDLAKYILFCDNRTSAFGMADNNIVNQVSSWGSVQTDSGFVNTFANSAIGAIPVIGDVIDVVSNQDSLNALGYVSGESCVAGNNVNRSDSPNWDTAKYYQRFIEDQSLAETSGLIEKSAVTAFLDDYYEKNPLDNSYEGILARYSGLEKDTVIALLDIIEYGNYIANYHPEERLYFGEPATEEKELKFDNEHTLAVDVMMPLGEIVYADVRNRNFVV